MYKMVDWNFCFMDSSYPKNICSFYWHLIMSFFLAPINAYGVLLQWCFDFEPIEKYRRSFNEDKWGRFTKNALAMCIAVFFGFCINIIIYVAIINRKFTSFEFNFMIWASIITPFFYTALLGGCIILNDKLKSKFCSPIEYK